MPPVQLILLLTGLAIALRRPEIVRLPGRTYFFSCIFFIDMAFNRAKHFIAGFGKAPN